MTPVQMSLVLKVVLRSGASTSGMTTIAGLSKYKNFVPSSPLTISKINFLTGRPWHVFIVRQIIRLDGDSCKTVRRRERVEVEPTDLC